MSDRFGAFQVTGLGRHGSDASAVHGQKRRFNQFAGIVDKP